MLKALLRLSLTRRPLILLFLLVFVGAGLFRFDQARDAIREDTGLPTSSTRKD